MADNQPRMYRQGDLLFIEVSQLPEKMDKASHILARGEATGHKHRATGQLQVFKNPKDGVIFLKGSGRILHEEHGPLAIPEGMYELRRQREYMEGVHRTKVRIVRD